MSGVLTARAAILGLVAGSADAAGWIGSGLFAAHMTGNTVLLGVSLANGDRAGAAARAAVIAGSFAGFFAGAVLLRGDGASRVRSVGALAAGLALLAASLRRGPGGVVLLAAALSLQNAAYREFGGETVNIGFLTGDLQSLAGALLAGERGRTRRRVIPALWISYLAGGALTAVVARGLAHPLLPAAIGLALFVFSPLGGRRRP